MEYLIYIYIYIFRTLMLILYLNTFTMNIILVFDLPCTILEGGNSHDIVVVLCSIGRSSNKLYIYAIKIMVNWL
jgi:hypothetical protein